VKAIPLHALRPGQLARVVELRSTDASRLDRLAAFGLVPGSTLCLQQLRPALVLCLGETQISVDREVAGEVWVEA
jgi:Fe2+ transport system protein FeoA